MVLRSPGRKAKIPILKSTIKQLLVVRRFSSWLAYVTSYYCWFLNLDLKEVFKRDCLVWWGIVWWSKWKGEKTGVHLLPSHFATSSVNLVTRNVMEIQGVRLPCFKPRNPSVYWSRSRMTDVGCNGQCITGIEHCFVNFFQALVNAKKPINVHVLALYITN